MCRQPVKLMSASACGFVDCKKTEVQFCDREMEKLTFTFSSTSPTIDGSSIDYTFDVAYPGASWQFSRRFSEFEFLLEQVCRFIGGVNAFRHS